MRLGETPVPIPNTMVKTQAADGTMLVTAWESRWLPDSFKKLTLKECFIQHRHVPMGGGKSEACVKECVNLRQQGSAVPYNWFLPVISEFKLIEFAND